jgi:hypothetical protein
MQKNGGMQMVHEKKYKKCPIHSSRKNSPHKKEENGGKVHMIRDSAEIRASGQ